MTHVMRGRGVKYSNFSLSLNHEELRFSWSEWRVGPFTPGNPDAKSLFNGSQNSTSIKAYGTFPILLLRPVRSENSC